jgi:hypothetical protein
MEDKLWNYIGKGDYIDGIPARDLTAADWARMNEDDRAAVENSRLYRRAPQPKAEEPPASEPAGEPGKEKFMTDEKPVEARAAKAAEAKQEKAKE